MSHDLRDSHILRLISRAFRPNKILSRYCTRLLSDRAHRNMQVWEMYFTSCQTSKMELLEKLIEPRIVKTFYWMLYSGEWKRIFWLMFIYSEHGDIMLNRSNNSVFLYARIYWNRQFYVLIRNLEIWMKLEVYFAVKLEKQVKRFHLTSG